MDLAMRDLKDLVSEHKKLLSEYKSFPTEAFGNKDNGFTRSPELKMHDAMIAGLTVIIRNHPDNRSFEDDLKEALGTRINNDVDFAQKVYSALCNVEWVHKLGTVYSCTWRYAGGLVAEIRNQGEDYLTFYCSGNEGVVDDEVAEALISFGWTWTELT